MNGELLTNIPGSSSDCFSQLSAVTPTRSVSHRRASQQLKKLAMEQRVGEATQVSSSCRCCGEEKQSSSCSSSSATSAGKQETACMEKVRSRLRNYGPCRQAPFMHTKNDGLCVEIGDFRVFFSARRRRPSCVSSHDDDENNDIVLVLSMEVFKFPQEEQHTDKSAESKSAMNYGSDCNGATRRRSSKSLSRSGSYSRRTKLMKLKSKMTEISDGNSTVMRGDQIVLLQVSSADLLDDQKRFDGRLDKFLLKAAHFSNELAACF